MLKDIIIIGTSLLIGVVITNFIPIENTFLQIVVETAIAVVISVILYIIFPGKEFKNKNKD